MPPVRPISLTRSPSQPAPAPKTAACDGCCARPANAWIARAIAGACPQTAPFRHWLLDSVLPPALLDALSGPDPERAPVAKGRRASINESRRFIGREAVAAEPGLAALAEGFDNCRTRRTIAALCGTELAGTHLRIERAFDGDGFWLEPHTDIGAKRLTLLVSLNDEPESGQWGTDLYDSARRPVARVAARHNGGLLFVPGPDSWHGFERRPIRGVRRMLIVNYVDESWIARDELVRG